MNDILLVIGIVLGAFILLFLPWIDIVLSNWYDRLSIRLAYPGQHFIVRGCNSYGVFMDCELILTRIEGDLFYFDYPKDYSGSRLAYLVPHHISNYRKSFWKI